MRTLILTFAASALAVAAPAAEALPWLREAPDMTVYVDEGGGATLELSPQGTGVAVAVDPRGWGAGMALPTPVARRSEGRSMDCSAYRRVVLEITLPAGASLLVACAEDGVGPAWAGPYAGARGADGEAWQTRPLIGAGERATIEIPWDRFERHQQHGNQAGGASLDAQALVSLGVHVPGGQGAFRFVLHDLRLE